MKIIDRFVLKSFIRPFLITFVVMVLFLLMQFVWKYIDDLVGRGVEWYYIAELLFYISATVVPMALPLAILLSSIMTFGSLGEQNEMGALKASGNSLIRIMRPITIFISCLAIGAFFFYNYVIPVANLKSETLLRNITNKKPALNIRQGVFYTGIESYSIKVGSKSGENQSTLHDVYVYDHSKKMGNLKVIVSDKGKMEVTEDEMYLNIELFDGNSYEDIYPKKAKERDNYPFVTSSFDSSLMRFSLSAFQGGDMHSGSRKDFDMLNVIQLDEATDSLNIQFAERQSGFSKQMREKYAFSEKATNQYIPLATNKDSILNSMDDNLLLNIEEKERTQIIQNALRIARSNSSYFENANDEFFWREKIIARHQIEWHKKFSVSVSCLVLFFIGAPLGAIIRKGGMGMPVVISVVIFIIYHVTSYSFEKLGRELIWSPMRGMWTANMLLFPIGMFLTYKSATDSALFNIELYLKPFQKVADLFRKKENKKASQA